jgi:hypothetical protein
MKLRIVSVQPCLAEDMVDTCPVAVMANVGTGAVFPVNGMTCVTNIHVGFQIRMLRKTMNPAGSFRDSAASRVEMAGKTTGYIS